MLTAPGSQHLSGQHARPSGRLSAFQLVSSLWWGGGFVERRVSWLWAWPRRASSVCWSSLYSRRNERRLRARGAVERGSGHYPVIVAIHSLWLVSTLVEGLLRGPEPPAWWPVPLAAFSARPAVAVLGDPVSGRELEHESTRRAGRKTRQEGTIPLLPSSQLRRRCRGGPDLPAHLRRLDNSGRLLSTERRPALRPHPNREPGAERAGRLK